MRHWLFKWFGIDWWESLGYSTDPEDGWCGSHIIDVRRSRITGEIQQLYFSGAAVPGFLINWIPVDEELRALVEQLEDD